MPLLVTGLVLAVLAVFLERIESIRVKQGDNEAEVRMFARAVERGIERGIDALDEVGQSVPDAGKEAVRSARDVLKLIATSAGSLSSKSRPPASLMRTRAIAKPAFTPPGGKQRHLIHVALETDDSMRGGQLKLHVLQSPSPDWRESTWVGRDDQYVWDSIITGPLPYRDWFDPISQMPNEIGGSTPGEYAVRWLWSPVSDPVADSSPETFLPVSKILRFVVPRDYDANYRTPWI